MSTTGTSFNPGLMTGLTNSQVLIYSNAVNTFLRIQAFNQDIRTRRLAGNKTLSYYIFKEGEETSYRQGQFILTQNNPNSFANFQDVEKI